VHHLSLRASSRRLPPWRPWLALVLLPLLLAACSAQPGPTGASHPAPRPTHNYAWFVAQLRASGATVAEREALPPSTDLRAPGRVVLVDGERLEAREYDSPRGIEADLGRSENGGQGPVVALGLSGGERQARPALYESDVLLVLYAGGNAEVAQLLARVLGPPIGGA